MTRTIMTWYLLKQIKNLRGVDHIFCYSLRCGELIRAGEHVVIKTICNGRRKYYHEACWDGMYG